MLDREYVVIGGTDDSKRMRWAFIMEYLEHQSHRDKTPLSNREYVRKPGRGLRLALSSALARRMDMYTIAVTGLDSSCPMIQCSSGAWSVLRQVVGTHDLMQCCHGAA